MINVGVIGYGYWGPNIVRNFFEADDCWISAVCDRQEERLASIKKRYPTIQTLTNVDELFKNPKIDAVAIVTPVSSHFDLAMRALKAGKHVLVEKPITETSEQAIQLIEEARRRNLVLMVDHTFVYTGAVRFMKDLVTRGKLGKLYYYDSVRVNLGIFQHDVNVLWDLAVHDLSIMNYVLDMEPTRVAATGISNIPNQPESIAYVTCFFEDNFIAHFHVNWLAPAKIRSTLLGGDRRMIVYNDLEPSEKIKIYDKGVVLKEKTEGVYEKLVGYRDGNMWAPKLDGTEALKAEIKHFLECIQTKQTPITDGEAGLKVVKILEAASESIKNQGRPVDVTPSGIKTV